jgi:soluble lytic murein transglycosylase-like protein
MQSPAPITVDTTPVEELVTARAYMYKHPLTPIEAKELAITATELNKETGISLGLILGLIEIESKYERKAKSKKKCKGLTQLSKGTADTEADKLGIEEYNIYSIKDNLTIGVNYLVDLYNEWYNWLDALSVYNMGFKTFAARGYRVNGYARAVIKRGKTIEKLLKNPIACKSF